MKQFMYHDEHWKSTFGYTAIGVALVISFYLLLVATP